VGHAVGTVKLIGSHIRIVLESINCKIEPEFQLRFFWRWEPLFRGNNPVAQCQEQIQAATDVSLQALRPEHITLNISIGSAYRAANVDLGLIHIPGGPHLTGGSRGLGTARDGHLAKGIVVLIRLLYLMIRRFG